MWKLYSVDLVVLGMGLALFFRDEASCVGGERNISSLSCCLAF